MSRIKLSTLATIICDGYVIKTPVHEKGIHHSEVTEQPVSGLREKTARRHKLSIEQQHSLHNQIVISQEPFDTALSWDHVSS